mmetsp:Transcript_13384/g.24222  ORF Transcript_13384/g.24222 Transcript_13384/m.24222 type:complete len:201 (-) Transcript_13384:1907-2509(-)
MQDWLTPRVRARCSPLVFSQGRKKVQLFLSATHLVPTTAVAEPNRFASGFVHFHCCIPSNSRTSPAISLQNATARSVSTFAFVSPGKAGRLHLIASKLAGITWSLQSPSLLQERECLWYATDSRLGKLRQPTLHFSPPRILTIQFFILPATPAVPRKSGNIFPCHLHHLQHGSSMENAWIVRAFEATRTLRTSRNHLSGG